MNWCLQPAVVGLWLGQVPELVLVLVPELVLVLVVQSRARCALFPSGAEGIRSMLW
jgi:hypothetical protein